MIDSDSKPADEPSVAEEPVSADEAAAEADQPKDPPLKKRRLNPAGAKSARPIPSGTKPPTTDDERARVELIGEADASDVSDASGPQESPPAAPLAQRQNAPAVELPPADVLDAALEAEIEAALASADAVLHDLGASALENTTTGDESLGEDLQGEQVSEAIEAIEATVGGIASEEDLEEGTRLKGTIQSIDLDSVLVDIGLRATGIVPRRQWDKTEPEMGQVIDVSVDRYDAAEGLIHLSLPRGRRRVGGDWDAVTVGMICDCVVNKANKGGLEVTIGSLRGFLPAGQVDRSYVEDLESFIGQKLSVEVVEVDPRRRNLIVSRRLLLEEERKDAEQEIWEQLEVGETRSGTVKTLKDYGAFIDLGGLDGFLHIGEISWSRLGHPSEVLTVGQAVEVKVLGIDKERSRVSLGMRQLTHDPWEGAAEVYTSGRQVGGVVTRIMDFGAFVELEPGIEGLVHISELDHARVRRVSDLLSEGQELDVQVLEVDLDRKRISLSLKAMKARPEAVGGREGSDESEEALVERIDRDELKGGTGLGDGGLFGDPDNFD